jgi:hypothetical protein
MAFAVIERLSDKLIEALQNDAGRQVTEIIDVLALTRPVNERIISARELINFHNEVMSCGQIYKKRRCLRHTEIENWLFERLYILYGNIKGARPGLAGPLYRFTLKGAELAGVKVSISPDNFRMRMKRILNRQRKGIENLAAVKSTPDNYH